MRRRLLIAALVAAPLSRARATDSPKDIVEGLYRSAARKKGEWDDPIFKAPARQRLFSKALLAAWTAADAHNKADEVGWLDFDPISNSQDPDVNDLRVTVLREDASKTSIQAAFRVAPDPKSRVDRVVFEFMLEDGAWKLDDIAGNPNGDRWSIRTLAKAAR